MRSMAPVLVVLVGFLLSMYKTVFTLLVGLMLSVLTIGNLAWSKEIPADVMAEVKRGCQMYSSSGPARILECVKKRSDEYAAATVNNQSLNPVGTKSVIATSADLTAAQKEAERLRQELAALKAEKAQAQQTISIETKLPLFAITNASSSASIIRAIQQQLTGLGYQPGPIDGQMGRKTKEAISAFQTSQKGKAGNTTDDSRLLSALVAAVDTKKTSTQVAAVTQPVAPTAQITDTTPPSINIASSVSVDTDSPTVRGSVSDDNKVVQVTVNGFAADLQNGSFSFTRYVPSTGTSVVIEAIDEWGNRSTKTVSISRSIVDTSDLMKFASLDPTKIKGQANRDAVALIIGVANYTRAPDAIYADSDASVFSDYARRALGIPQSNIKVLTNITATRSDMQVALKQWLRGRIEEGKTDVYVFYAGHGLASPDGEDLYLLPYDGVPSLLEDTSLQRTELFKVISDAHPKSATVFFDTCYSGTSRTNEVLVASRGIVIAPKEQNVPLGFTLFSAASGLQISGGLDEAKHGLFSYYLMKGMEGPADVNSDKKITAGELHAYVQKNVKQQAIRLGRDQTPEMQGDAERVLVAW